MPYLLSTDLSVGDLDPSGPITHCRAHMHDNDPDSKAMVLSIAYGRMDGSAFKPANLQPTDKKLSHIIADPEYTTLVTTHKSNDGELTYLAAKRALYEHLSSEAIIPAGSIT